MKYFYDRAHDSLFLKFRDGDYAESQEIAPGFVIDFDRNGVPIAIDIANASRHVEVAGLESGLESYVGERPVAAHAKS